MSDLLWIGVVLGLVMLALLLIGLLGADESVGA